jgi:predicted metal-dependent hydrolase
MRRSGPRHRTEARRVVLLGDEVPYLLKRSPRRRTIALRIDRNGLTVSAPAGAAQSRLEEVLRERARWVLDKLLEIRARQAPGPLWRDGECLPLLGGSCRLVVSRGPARAQAVLAGKDLVVRLADPEDGASVRAKTLKWYRRAALAHFTGRVAHYAGRLGVAVPPLRLSNAATRWGSCNARGEIRLNWRLIKLSPRLIDYVVAHELAHLLHLDHSPAFWATVAGIYPDYAAARAELRRLGDHTHAF